MQGIINSPKNERICFAVSEPPQSCHSCELGNLECVKITKQKKANYTLMSVFQRSLPLTKSIRFIIPSAERITRITNRVRAPVDHLWHLLPEEQYLIRWGEFWNEHPCILTNLVL